MWWTALRRTPVRVVALLTGLWLVGGGSSIAELVILEGGGVLKVEGFQRSGDRIDLALPGGGSMTLSILRIERILADEIVDTPADELSKLELEIEFFGQRLVPTTPFADLIMDTARRHAINPRLIAAMVRVESAFEPTAISRKGAAGLMQLMPATAKRFGVERQEILRPERNLDAGVRYVRWLNERFEGDLSLILAGYNAGEGSVERYRGVPPYRETREYIRRVYSAAVSESPDRARE